MSLNPDQFREHLDQLQEMTGLEYGPNSISTRSGLVLPARHQFEYIRHANLRGDSIWAYSSIPDERGTQHHVNIRMAPSDPSDPLVYSGRTAYDSGINPHMPKHVDTRRYNGQITISTDPNLVATGSPEEMLEKFRSTPIETSERTLNHARYMDEFDNEDRQNFGIAPHEAPVHDFRMSSDLDELPLESHAYDFRTGNLRPVRGQ